MLSLSQEEEPPPPPPAVCGRAEAGLTTRPLGKPEPGRWGESCSELKLALSAPDPPDPPGPPEPTAPPPTTRMSNSSDCIFAMASSRDGGRHVGASMAMAQYSSSSPAAVLMYTLALRRDADAAGRDGGRQAGAMEMASSSPAAVLMRTVVLR